MLVKGREESNDKTMRRKIMRNKKPMESYFNFIIHTCSWENIHKTLQEASFDIFTLNIEIKFKRLTLYFYQKSKHNAWLLQSISGKGIQRYVIWKRKQTHTHTHPHTPPHTHTHTPPPTPHKTKKHVKCWWILLYVSICESVQLEHML